MAEQIPIRDLVPEKFRTGDYSRIRTTMEENLTRPEKIDRYATHEAGHLLYLQRTQLIVSPTDANWGIPTIYAEGAEIGYFMAGVSSKKVSFGDETLVYTQDLLDKLALIAVAGNVFELESFNADEETEPAARGDERTLFKHCHVAMTRNQLPFQGKTLWSAVFPRVTVDVHQHSFSDTEVKFAKLVIRKHCFGLV